MEHLNSIDPPAKLTAYVLHKLAEQPDRVAQIALDAKVPKPWLDFLIKGKITNPGVDRIEKLYEYLSGKKLKI